MYAYLAAAMTAEQATATADPAASPAADPDTPESMDLAAPAAAPLQREESRAVLETDRAVLIVDDVAAPSAPADGELGGDLVTELRLTGDESSPRMDV